MFCTNCGNQIGNNAKFCMYCGASLHKSESAVYEVNNNRNIQKDSSLIIMFIVVAISFLAQIIFLFVDSLYVSIKTVSETWKETISLSAAWESSFPILKVIVILMSSTSIITCIIPLIENDFSKRRRMIIAKITVFINLIFLLISLILIAVALKYSLDKLGHIFALQNRDIGDIGFHIYVGMTSSGWLYLITCIINFNLLFFISNKTNKLSKQNIK